jgi:hypothetical protein
MMGRGQKKIPSPGKAGRAVSAKEEKKLLKLNLHRCGAENV